MLPGGKANLEFVRLVVEESQAGRLLARLVECGHLVAQQGHKRGAAYVMSSKKMGGSISDMGAPINQPKTPKTKRRT